MQQNKYGENTKQTGAKHISARFIQQSMAKRIVVTLIIPVE